MPTNDEKISKIEKKLHDEFSVSPILYIDLEALIYEKARSATIKEIFAEIGEIEIAPDVKVNQLKGFNELKKEHKVD